LKLTRESVEESVPQVSVNKQSNDEDEDDDDDDDANESFKFFAAKNKQLSDKIRNRTNTGFSFNNEGVREVEQEEDDEE
jgi:hypothetical protein